MQSRLLAQASAAAFSLAPTGWEIEVSEGKNNKQISCLQSRAQKHFSCILGFSRSSRLFKKYLAQIEHLLDVMEK
jgi:hypothetical protein